MADYDSKSIPILNDVIDDDDITDEQKVTDLSNLKAPLDDHSFDSNSLDNDGFTGDNREANNLDLFTDELSESIDETEVITPTISDVENNTPEIGDINDVAYQDSRLFLGTAAVSTLEDDQLTGKISDEPEAESALISHHADEEDLPHVEVEVEPALVTESDEQVAEQVQPDADTASTPSISLQTVTEDIVKQIMPDLEEQLRSLVKQALEEKLPEEFFPPSSPGDKQDQ